MVTSMYLAYIRGCYAVATSLVMGWVGWGGMVTSMYLAYIRGCYTWSSPGVGYIPFLIYIYIYITRYTIYNIMRSSPGVGYIPFLIYIYNPLYNI